MWTARVTHRSHPGSDEPGAGPILAGPRSVDNSSQKERAQRAPYSSIFLVLTKGTTLLLRGEALLHWSLMSVVRFALWCAKLRQQGCVCLWSAD